MTLRPPQCVLVLSLALAKITGSALAATPDAIAIESGATKVAVGAPLTLTPNLNLTPDPDHSESVESESRSKSKSKDLPRLPDSMAGAPDPVIDRLIDFQQYRFGLPPPDFDYDAAGPFGAPSVSRRPSWRTYVDHFAPSPKMVLIQSPGLART